MLFSSWNRSKWLDTLKIRRVVVSINIQQYDDIGSVLYPPILSHLLYIKTYKLYFILSYHHFYFKALKIRSSAPLLLTAIISVMYSHTMFFLALTDLPCLSSQRISLTYHHVFVFLPSSWKQSPCPRQPKPIQRTLCIYVECHTMAKL